jgi:hypothetical protein
MDEAEVQRNREQWRQKQAEERQARLELKRARVLVPVAAEKEAMGGQMDSEESIAKQIEDRMKELFDMELVGENSFAELTRGQSRRSGTLPEELEQHVQTAQTAEGVYRYHEDSLWSVRPERGSLLGEKNISKCNQSNSLWEERQLEEERLDRFA